MNATGPSESSINVVGICGSIRPGSYTRLALQVALEGATAVGAKTHLIDLNDYELVFCDGKQDESMYPNDVFRLREDVGRAHGIILGTPKYHGGISGVLKNALDLMGFAEFEGKMIGLVGVSGGDLGAAEPLSVLRAIGRTLHAWVIPEEASISNAWTAFDKEGHPKDEALEKRLKTVGQQVARFAYLHTSKKAQDFVTAWEGAMENPGGAG